MYSARMAVPKMVKNGFNSFFHGFFSSGRADAPKNSKTDAGPWPSPNHERRIKTIFSQFGSRHARYVF